MVVIFCSTATPFKSCKAVDVTILILSGPPAAGKNTVAERLAKRLTRTAVVDTDYLRNMANDGGEDGDAMWLGALNACALAENFAEAGYSTVIVEVLDDEMAEFYRAHLSDHDVRIVLLMPTREEVNRRLISHTDYLSRGDIGALYTHQQQFSAYDEKIDNSVTDPETVAMRILEGLSMPAGG